MPASITAYEKFTFTGPLTAPAEARGHELKRPVYVRGEKDAPPVIVIQELPGIMPETFGLCDHLVEAGFRVYLPHLFGPLGKVSLIGNTLRVFCMRREFAIFAANKSSPIVNWLRALARNIKSETNAKGVGAPGVGVIGMCLTGNFAISMMADEAVLAGVASQPSLPIRAPHALHMSEDEVRIVHDKLDAVGPMLAYRFEEDPLCPGAKFKALNAAFNDGPSGSGKTRIKLTTLPGEGHSVLTGHFVDEAGHPTRAALDEVITYFKERLSE